MEEMKLKKDLVAWLMRFNMALHHMVAVLLGLIVL